MFRHPTQRHIAVLLPIILVHRNKRQHINGSLKHIDGIALSGVMKAVPWIASVHVALERFAMRISSSLMRMTSDTILIKTNEYGIVIFGVLIEHLCSSKRRDYPAVKAARLGEVRIYASHIMIGFRNYKRFRRLRLPLFAREVRLPLLAV
ncbi:hypothetical protein SDC9_196344 [bioreactor metagenome]|uniref:Uncharacterized protein n=1 Tax=bioreactor metagenome TaxID=1076179 RepID=A0A645ID38_9ZZZZ